jgi:hypothetical protein
MTDAGLFVGWNRPVAGKEMASLELFDSFMNYLKKAQSDGRIENFEPVLLNHHGGDLNGFILIRGDRQKLQQVAHDHDFQQHTIKAEIVLDHFGVLHAYLGPEMTRRMDVFKRSI